MDTTTIRALNAINRSFYRKEAEAFSVTRKLPWPGWHQILELFEKSANLTPLRVLDIGCGNGRLMKPLAERFGPNFTYTGVDSSEPLIERAKEATEEIKKASFILTDLVEDSLAHALPNGPFDFVAIFGFLHHVPSRARRLMLLRTLSRTLSKGGLMVLSVWNFEDRKRFLNKKVPWSELSAINLPIVTESELEPGDQLLRWGKDRVRYCHQVRESEIEHWIKDLALRCTLRFREDGQDGDLNEYIVLENSLS